MNGRDVVEKAGGAISEMKAFRNTLGKDYMVSEAPTRRLAASCFRGIGNAALYPKGCIARVLYEEICTALAL